jgi:hypothetical protein
VLLCSRRRPQGHERKEGRQKLMVAGAPKRSLR